METKLKIGIIVLIIGIVTVGGFFLIPLNEKSCSVDNNCVLVNKSCCSSCSPGDSINKISAIRINLLKKITCRGVLCPLINCIYPPTTYKAICKNQNCIRDEFINCQKVCSQETLKQLSAYLNKSEEELIQKCNCDDFLLMMEGCDVGNIKKDCLRLRTIVLGIVRETKLLQGLLEEVEIDVDRVFNGKFEKKITFGVRKYDYQLNKGDKVKVFLTCCVMSGDYKLLDGHIIILDPEEYQNLLGTKFVEFISINDTFVR